MKFYSFSRGNGSSVIELRFWSIQNSGGLKILLKNLVLHII